MPYLFTQISEMAWLSAASQSSCPRLESRETFFAVSTSLAESPQLLSQLLSSSVIDPATDNLCRVSTTEATCMAEGRLDSETDAHIRNFSGAMMLHSKRHILA